jgi:hypothetical protein
MKIKTAQLSAPLNLPGSSGVRTLGAGRAGLRPGEVEQLEMVGEMIKVTSKAFTVYIHISRFDFVTAEV